MHSLEKVLYYKAQNIPTVKPRTNKKLNNIENKKN